MGQYPETVSPVWQLGGLSAGAAALLRMADLAGRLGFVGRSCQLRAGEQKQWPLEAQTWKSFMSEASHPMVKAMCRPAQR